MATVRVLVLRAAGINCDQETSFAWNSAGASAQRVHVGRLIEQPHLLKSFQVLTIPGGFSYGDDIASGRILGNQLHHHLGDGLRQFVERGNLILGICNGYQVLVRSGLLPGTDCPVKVTLTRNDSGRYEDRWVRIRAEVDNCPFLEKGAIFDLPAAHGEGKLVTENCETAAAQLRGSGRIALRYVGCGREPAQYPKNPSGSIENAAGLMDSTGHILGIMPHPERSLLKSQAPDHLRDIHTDTGGGRLFRRAVDYFR